jgi:PKHD-type hydroxylase
MIVTVPQLLTGDEIAALREIASGGRFASGKATAGRNLRAIKDNLEISDASATEQIRQIIQGGLARNRRVSDAIMPKLMTPPLMSLYRPGMAYGRHLDLAMAERNRLRSDISMTLFLSDLDAYDGGALRIETDYGVQEVRLPPGDAVFYPTLFPHQVNPVTRGERLACVLWIQSLVREPERRRILSDLSDLGGVFDRATQDAAYNSLMRCHQNLLRMWAS